MSSFDLNGHTIAYDDVGPRDARAIVLLHGFPLNRSMWRGQFEALSQTHRVVAVDVRGHGESSVTQGTVTMAEMADDVSELLKELKIATAVIGGLSMGGYVAWEFWRRHRQQLSALILCDTRAVADTEDVARAREIMAAQVVTAGAEMAEKSMLGKLMGPNTYESQPDIVEQVRHMILATDVEAIAATQRGMAKRIDMTSHLADVDVATLVLCGVDDVISPPEEMKGFAAKMPNAQFVQIENAGHLAPLEQPTATNQAIQDFLANL